MREETKSAPKICWISHIEQWQQSGLSQRAYCEQAGINHKRFYYHAQRLKNKDNKPTLRFIEAKAVAQTVLSKSERPKLALRLILPNQIQVVLEEISLDLLPEVLTVASGLC